MRLRSCATPDPRKNNERVAVVLGRNPITAVVVSRRCNLTLDITLEPPPLEHAWLEHGRELHAWCARNPLVSLVMGRIPISAVDNREILTEYRDWPLARATQEKLPIFEPGHGLVEGPDLPKKAAVPSNVDPGETPQPTWRDLWVHTSAECRCSPSGLRMVLIVKAVQLTGRTSGAATIKASCRSSLRSRQ